MKIQSVQHYNSTSKAKRNYTSLPIQNSSENNSKISFGNGYGWVSSEMQRHTPPAPLRWAKKLLRIMTRTDSEMKDLAEYFHGRSDESLYYVISDSRPYMWSSEEKIKMETKRLIEFVSPIRDNKAKMLNKVNELELKKGIGLSNLVGQKARLNSEFISLIAAEKEGMNPVIKNGILIHGTSKLKDEFITWLTESSGAVVKTIQHDTSNPMKTISDIIELAENSETAFKHSKTRTLIVVKDLDKMLMRPKNRDEVKLINGFKSFAEDLSEKYHTTLIAKTDKNLDEFEPATTASNRLGVHVDLKDGITEEELNELGDLNAEVKRLDDKAAQAGEKFTHSDDLIERLFE